MAYNSGEGDSDGDGGGYGGYSPGPTYGGGGLTGAPDVGTLGGNLRNENGDTSSDLGPTAPGRGGYTSAEQGYANEGVNANPYGYDFSSAGYSNPGAFGLGDVFGYNAGTGLPTNEGQYAGNANSYGFSDFANSPFGKVVKGFVSMNPFGRAALAGYGLMNGASPVSTALGMVPGAAGALARTAYGAATSGNPGGSLGSTAGGMFGSNVGGALGSGIAGPMGGALGGMLGGMFGSNVGGQMGTQIGQAGTQPQGMANSLAGSLAGMYGSYQANKAASANAGAINNQISQLSNMYSQNSPYAQQLRQELARKDAAAGRNSQYGPREAQLQALLADKANQTASTIGNLSGQAQTANTASQVARAQQLAQLLKMGQQSGLGNYLQQGLSGMFNSGGGNTNYQIPEAYNNQDEYGY